MSDEPNEAEVPDGAAVFPLIPAELGVDPLLLAVLHAIVFLAGSDDDVVHPDAADEALEYMAAYLQRLDGRAAAPACARTWPCLAAYARQEKWPKQLTLFLKTFLADFGVGDGERGMTMDAFPGTLQPADALLRHRRGRPAPAAGQRA